MKLDNSEIFIFFDDGNVLNDNQIRGKQWQKLVGEYMAPRFGREPRSWGLANARFISNFLEIDFPKIEKEYRDKSYQEAKHYFIEEWINQMFDYMAIARPDKDKYNEIYYGAVKYVDLRVRSAFPGVNQTIKELFDKGYILSTSSAVESMELKFYLEGMELKQYFTAFYGPDLVNTRKINENFYNVIFKDLGITPNQSIVIDDNPYFLKMAEKFGGNVIQACLTGEFLPQFRYMFKRMKDLPEIIAKVKEEKFI